MATLTSKPTHPNPSPLSALVQTTTSSLPIPDTTARLLSLPLEILHNLQHQHAWTALELHYIHPTQHTIHQLPLSPSPPSQTPIPSINAIPIPPSTTQFLLSGLPPRHAYIHPDAQMRLLREGRTQRDLRVQREWVVPLALAQTVSVHGLAGVFDALAERDEMMALVVGAGGAVEDEDEDGDGDADGVDGHGKGTDEGLSDERSTGTSRSVSGTARASSGAGAGAGGLGQGYTNPKRVLLAMKARDGLGGDGTVAYYVCLEGEVKPRQNG